MARGGYQEPTNPAPVSGPGALSQRTDGQPKQQLPDASYGEQKEFQAAQESAPMAAGPPIVPNVIPENAPTQRPDEPVTAGNPLGPGPGPEALIDQEAEEALERATNFLPALMILASQPGASPQTRQLVRQLSSQGYYRGG